METDLSKLKVADLKKELKIRGLSQTGKRNELLERLQLALAGGVGIEGGAEDDGDEEYDEDEILGGDDADDDDSKMTPLEEAAALAAAEKAAATPIRGARRAVPTAAADTPRPAQKKLALRRTTSPSLTVQDEAPPAPSPIKAAAASPLKPALKKAVTPVRAVAPSAAAEAAATGEPPKKIVKLAVESDKENGEEPATDKLKSALELRAERFGVKSDQTMKQKRAERFGTSNGQKPGKLSMEVGTLDVEKLKARASRFGETVAKKLTQAEVDEKKKARSERFGDGDAAANSEKKDLTSAEALAARAVKFGGAKKDAAPVEPIVSASGKKLIVVASSEDAVTKLKRAARFGA